MILPLGEEGSEGAKCDMSHFAQHGNGGAPILPHAGGSQPEPVQQQNLTIMLPGLPKGRCRRPVAFRALGSA